jgi:hypothetical protein
MRRPKISDLIVHDDTPPCDAHSWELVVKMSGRFYRCRNCDEVRDHGDPPADGWTEGIEIPEREEP